MTQTDRRIDGWTDGQTLRMTTIGSFPKKEKTTTSNYRPIALVTAESKLSEICIFEILETQFLKANAAYYLNKIIIDENDALTKYNKIPLGHNRTNGAVYFKIYFNVEICSAH